MDMGPVPGTLGVMQEYVQFRTAVCLIALLTQIYTHLHLATGNLL